MTTPQHDPAVERVTFGDGLVGHLHTPAAAGPDQAAVVITGPLTGVKEQVAGTYAAGLARSGVTALAFDHTNWGESSGARRQHEDPGAKAQDLREAVTYLLTRTATDPERLGILGVCLGGGYALRAAATDPRIHRVAAVAGAFNSPAAFRDGMGAGPYRTALAGLAQQVMDDPEAMLPAVALDGPAAMGGREPHDYYGTSRSASPHWHNEVTVESLWNLMTLDTLSPAQLLDTVPLLVIHGRTDAYCTPQGAQAAYDLATGTKDIHWLDTSNHIDLYDVDEYVDPAISALAAFFSGDSRAR